MLKSFRCDIIYVIIFYTDGGCNLKGLDEKVILKKLIENEALFNNLYVINQEFKILPKDKKHYGVSINYQDIAELRNEFIDELVDSIIDWVYSSEKYIEHRDRAMKKGKSEAAANSEVRRKAKQKFRGVDSETLLIQGQLGELLLFHFIQKFMCAVPLLRKMKITTSSELERFGADAIHYKVKDGKNIIILGEAKTYTSKYKFNDAFITAQKSILNTYKTHKEELNLYVHEDFLDEDLNEVAEAYLNNTLEKPEVHLVSIIVYNETEKIEINDEENIKMQIKEVIENRYENFDDNKINLTDDVILKRITYIVFPIWKLKALAEEFQKKI